MFFRDRNWSVAILVRRFKSGFVTGAVVIEFISLFFFSLVFPFRFFVHLFFLSESCSSETCEVVCWVSEMVLVWHIRLGLFVKVLLDFAKGCSFCFDLVFVLLFVYLLLS